MAPFDEPDLKRSNYRESVEMQILKDRVAELEKDNEWLSGALMKIAKKGANPITEGGCKDRKDFMQLVTEMWIIARESLKGVTNET